VTERKGDVRLAEADGTNPVFSTGGGKQRFLA
jgi:hypothetical protein